jgi:hypothetical protein
MTTPNTDAPSASADREQLTCPRCGTRFACHVSDPLLCQCAEVDLPAELTARLYAEWRDCLCVNCLRELGAAAQRDDAGA